MKVEGSPGTRVSATISSNDRLLDVMEAADLLRLRPRTLYKLAYQRRLPVVKVGRATRFRLSSLVQLIEAWERPASRPLRPRDGE